MKENTVSVYYFGDERPQPLNLGFYIHYIGHAS